jgi:DNA mismatch repair protein MLH1
MESLQITDDGCGRRKADLLLAAVRFATSKLTTFDDLKSIRTFGFRGEALASASMVSKLSILTKQASADIAYKCQYTDGEVESGFPKASAGTNGTTVRVDSLFYNIPSRRKSFSRDSEEYNRVLDVAQRYAVHRAGDGIGMVCKKAKQKTVDLNTKSLPTVQRLMRHKKAKQDSASVTDQDRIRAKKEAVGHVFGVEVAREVRIDGRLGAPSFGESSFLRR